MMLAFADDPCRYSRSPRRPYPVGSTRGTPLTITPRWQISPASSTAYRSSRSVRQRSRCRPSAVRGVLERSGRLMIHYGIFPPSRAAGSDGGYAERASGLDLVGCARPQADRRGRGPRRFRQFAGDGADAGDLVDVDAAWADALAVRYLGGAEVPAERPQRPAARPGRLPVRGRRPGRPAPGDLPRVEPGQDLAQPDHLIAVERLPGRAEHPDLDAEPAFAV